MGVSTSLKGHVLQVVLKPSQEAPGSCDLRCCLQGCGWPRWRILGFGFCAILGPPIHKMTESFLRVWESSFSIIIIKKSYPLNPLVLDILGIPHTFLTWCCHKQQPRSGFEVKRFPLCYDWLLGATNNHLEHIVWVHLWVCASKLQLYRIASVVYFDEFWILSQCSSQGLPQILSHLLDSVFKSLINKYSFQKQEPKSWNTYIWKIWN